MHTRLRESWLASFRVSRVMAFALLGLCAQVAFVPSGSAQRGPHIVRVEGAGAFAFRNDDDRDSLGGGFGLGYEYRFIDPLGLSLHAAGFYFPFDGDEFSGDGVATYHGIGAGLRLHFLSAAARTDIWLEPAAKFVLTGELSRPGVDLGLGADFSVGDGGLAVGPFVRYSQVIQGSDDALGGADGRFLQFGAALSWGNTAPKPEPEPPPMAPAPVELVDADADGIDDANDRCPSEPEDVDGHDDSDGCPDLDNDGDGVSDDQDACPNVAGVPEARGCAPAAPELESEPEPEETRSVELTQRANFASGKAVLNPRALSQLRAVLKVLQSEPGIRRVRVSGHADDRGSESFNQELSERRAQAAVDWLVAKGVDQGRLDAIGRGSSAPIAEGSSPAARAKNRRIEFEIIDPPGGQLPASAN